MSKVSEIGGEEKGSTTNGNIHEMLIYFNYKQFSGVYSTIHMSYITSRFPPPLPGEGGGTQLYTSLGENIKQMVRRVLIA